MRWLIRFDVSTVYWVPSSQDCQRGMHPDCDVHACGCTCHLTDPFYRYIDNPFGYWEGGDVCESDQARAST